MCEAYALQYGWNAFLMPTNLYGPGDNFSETQSHVLPALIRRFYEARRMRVIRAIWGTGTRRSSCVDDLASAALFSHGGLPLVEPINVGAGMEVHRELMDPSRPFQDTRRSNLRPLKPDGTSQAPRFRQLHTLGWQPNLVSRRAAETLRLV